MDRRRLPSARRHHHSRPPRPCCGLQAQPVPATAQHRQATLPLRRRLLDTTRPHHRRSSTLPPPPATPRQAPTTARRRPTCMEVAQLRHPTPQHPPPGLQHLLRLTPQQAQPSKGVPRCSSRLPAQATHLHRLLSLLARRVRGTLETNILPTRPQTINSLD
jgi:hypothetical protein